MVVCMEDAGRLRPRYMHGIETDLSEFDGIFYEWQFFPTRRVCSILSISTTTLSH